MGMKVEKNALTVRLDEAQAEYVSRAVSTLTRKRRYLVQMATGTGKTVVGCKVILSFPRARVLWVTQTEELIRQTVSDIELYVGVGNVGIFRRDERPDDERVIVASVQSLCKPENLKFFDRDEFGLVVVDEAHHAAANTWRAIVEYFDAKKLGLTATPQRADGQDIYELFGEPALKLTYEEAKERKLIAEEEYRIILTASKFEGLVMTSGEYRPEDLDRLVVSKRRNEVIVDSYLKYARRFMAEHAVTRKAICFCITQRHAMRMAELFNEAGVKAGFLVGKTGKRSSAWSVEHRPQTEKERAEVYEEFQHGDLEVLCVVSILNEGKNVRDVSALLMCRPTRSKTVLQQQLGRGCRRVEGR